MTSLAFLGGIIGVGLPTFACDLCAGVAVGSIRARRHCTGGERVGGKTRGHTGQRVPSCPNLESDVALYIKY